MPKAPKKSEFLEIRRAAGVAIAIAAAAAALPSMAGPSLRADFERVDVDRNARISLAEMTGGGHVVVKAQVTASPGDPRISDSVLDARVADRSRVRELILKAVFDRLDTDRDGTVTFEEYRRYERPGLT